MARLLVVLLIFAIPASAYESCKTIHQKPGKCVLINHCPHLFSAILNPNNTSNGSITKDHVQKSHCGFESILMPKVCCPLEAVKLYSVSQGVVSKRASKCGLHTPGGESDPWIALIEYEIPGRRAYLCGGVLIHKRHILTPAHCIQGRHLHKTARLVNVRFGDYNPEFLPLILQVEDSIVHEDYNPDDPNRYNDIALVRLKKKVSFKSGAIRPICLPINTGKKTGDALPLAGWERTQEDTFVKRSGIATVWNNSLCETVLNGTGVRLVENQICAGGKKSLADKNRIDVGGILMDISNDTSYSVVGIMSLKPPCCDKDYPRVYTKVSSYINWIFSNLDP